MVSTYTLKKQAIRCIESKNRYITLLQVCTCTKISQADFNRSLLWLSSARVQLQGFQTTASLYFTSLGSCHLNSVWPILMYFRSFFQILIADSLPSLYGHRGGGYCSKGKLFPLLTFHIITLAEGLKGLGPMPYSAQAHAILTFPAGIQPVTDA